jgi:hypothetical protein
MIVAMLCGTKARRLAFTMSVPAATLASVDRIGSNAGHVWLTSLKENQRNINAV